MHDPISSLLAVPDVLRLLADRCRALRLAADLKRTTLASRSGVSARTLQRFEDTGEVSLRNLLRLAHALGRLPEFGELLAPPAARTLADLDAQTEKTAPKRGRI